VTWGIAAVERNFEKADFILIEGKGFLTVFPKAFF
jgi:hypothetical protein